MFKLDHNTMMGVQLATPILEHAGILAREFDGKISAGFFDVGNPYRDDIIEHDTWTIDFDYMPRWKADCLRDRFNELRGYTPDVLKEHQGKTVSPSSALDGEVQS